MSNRGPVPLGAESRRSRPSLAQRSDRKVVGACSVLLALLLGAAGAAPANLAPEAAAPPESIDPAGISGALVICGGGELPEAVMQRFTDLAGGKRARIVYVPTANANADSADADQLLAPWRRRQVASATLLHTRDRQRANDPQFLQPLKEATAVWFGGGIQSRIADAYLGAALEKDLYALLQRGGVVGGTSAGAAIQSRVMIAGGRQTAQLAAGFDLLPGAIIDQHFLKRGRQRRLIGAIDSHPGLVGYGIDEKTALVVQGRRLEVLGQSTVTVYMAASETRPRREFVLNPGDWADLTELRRAALQRAGPPFPPAQPAASCVERGSLVIVGGRAQGEAFERFVQLAGGAEGRIVVLPTSAADPLPEHIRNADSLRRAGARNVRVLRGRTRDEVESDAFAQALGDATGVWFGGGRQWRFVDAYAGTRAERLFHDVLRRGGVIGGSSAGASIQAEYLVRGSPRGNQIMMAEGYERGFRFLPGAAIDQHFTQRNRLSDMTALIRTYPQLLGIGIDEETGLIVRGCVAEVFGRHQVYFYEGAPSGEDGPPPFQTLVAGQRYDLEHREILSEEGGKREKE